MDDFDFFDAIIVLILLLISAFGIFLTGMFFSIGFGTGSAILGAIAQAIS